MRGHNARSGSAPPRLSPFCSQCIKRLLFSTPPAVSHSVGRPRVTCDGTVEPDLRAFAWVTKATWYRRHYRKTALKRGSRSDRPRYRAHARWTPPMSWHRPRHAARLATLSRNWLRHGGNILLPPSVISMTLVLWCSLMINTSLNKHHINLYMTVWREER